MVVTGGDVLREKREIIVINLFCKPLSQSSRLIEKLKPFSDADAAFLIALI